MALGIIIIFSTLIPFSTNAQFATWKNGSSSLPQMDSQIAVGYDSNSTIWLLGGKNHTQHLVSFDMNTKQFTDHGLNHFPFELSGGQFYKQIFNKLWLISADGTYLNIFDLISQTIQYPYNNISIPDISTNGCLTSLTVNGLPAFKSYNHSYLIIMGGINSASLNIFDIYSNAWLTGLPSMTQTRSALSCVAHNHKLYAFGGKNDVSQLALSTIETADITSTEPNINIGAWGLIAAALTQPAAFTIASYYAEYIIIIGGGYDTVHVLNTLDDTISHTQSLQSAVNAPAFIHVNGVAYAFGGETDKYQMVALHGTVVYAEEGPLELSQQASGSQGRTYHIPDIEITFDILFESVFALAFEQTIIFIGRSGESYGYPRIYTDYSTGGSGNVCVDWYDPDDFGGIEMVAKACPELDYIDRWHHYHFHLNSDYMYVEVDGVVLHLSDNPAAFNEDNNPLFIRNIFIGQDTNNIMMKNIAIYSRSSFVSLSPTAAPTNSPTLAPTSPPTQAPSLNPTRAPSQSPTSNPTLPPTQSPTLNPTQAPTQSPSANPTMSPTQSPTIIPTHMPTIPPTKEPTISPTYGPTPSPFDEQHVVIQETYDTTIVIVVDGDDDDDGYVIDSASNNSGTQQWKSSDILSIVFGCILLSILIVFIVKKYRKKSKVAVPQEDLEGNMDVADVEILKLPTLPVELQQNPSIIPGAEVDLPSEEEDAKDDSSSGGELYGGQATQKGEEIGNISDNEDENDAEELFLKHVDTMDGIQATQNITTTTGETEGDTTATQL